ncbi:MAG: polysaccharide deacetylase family protein [Bacteroidota bacterium]
MRKRSLLLLLFIAATISSAQVRSPVPVLCYHGFADDTTGVTGKLTEQYARFEDMLRFLARSGYQSVFPEEMQSPPEAISRPVVITFDDGRKDQLRAAEMMHRYGFKGIFFIIPARIEAESDKSMTPTDLRQLVAWGHQIGVHGFAHQSLPSSQEETEASVSTSLEQLTASNSGQSSFLNFAYPFGHYDTATYRRTAAVYPFLHTVNPGYWDGVSNLLPRMLITSDNPGDFFKTYVLGSTEFQPVLELVTANGSTADRVEFRSRKPIVIEHVELLSVSADKDGYHYAIHPAASALHIEGSKVMLNLSGHLQRYYHDTRTVISYALVERRERGEIVYLSPGVMHWVVR